MGKKCIPGVICIENMTLFVLLVILVLIAYLYYTQVVKPQSQQDSRNVVVVATGSLPTRTQPPLVFGGLATRRDTISDPYAPPMQTDNGIYYPPVMGDIRGGIPINIETRAVNTTYQQVGILTKSGGRNGELILPLMGRRTMAGRDKWQYYTMTTTGNMNTKLPISVNGKSCTSEYGCDSVNNGDTVYVEGYNDSFRVTAYENNLFQYIPF
jgi:hypothetical protein